jgi:hypothetical protein
MKAVVIILLSIIAFVACLALGFYADGFSFNSPTPTIDTIQGSFSPTDAILASTPTQSSAKQRTIVFIQVDDLTNPSSQLIATWLIMYFPDNPKITWLLVYPPAPANQQPQYRELGKSFTITPEGLPGNAYISALQSFGVQFNGIIITDTLGIAKTIDWLKGINMGDGNKDGTTVSNRLIPPWQNMNSANQWQTKVFQGVCQKAEQLTLDNNWLQLMIDLAPSHFHTDLGMEQLVNDWKALMTLPETPKCEIIVPN